MQNTVMVFMTLIHGGVFGGVRSYHENYVSPRSILSNFSHRRGPRDLNTDDLQAVLKLADLSGDIPSPCRNGGTLLHHVKKNAYVCQCSDKYEGRHCEIKTKVCIEEENACKFYKNSSVTSECRTVQGNGFVCHHHPPQYRTNWCRTKDMENNQAICPENWTCLDHILGKYQGYRCLPPGHIISPKPRGIRQSGILEKCSCHNGGHCNKDATCVCLPHFTGLYCESQINYCNSNPCPLNIDCEPVLGGYSCNCPALRGGPRCRETRRLDVSIMVNPRFNYHASQHVSVPSTCLLYLEEIGTLPKLIIDFGDGTVVTMFEEDFHQTNKLNDILISFLYQPVDNKAAFYVVNFTHAYETEGLYNISLAAWNMQYIAMRNNFTVLVSSSENCEFSVKLINAAATPETATIYQRRHSINIHSVSAATCPGTRLKHSWALYTVPNMFTAHTPEMLKRSSPDTLTDLISEYHVPPYVLSFGNYVLHLTVETLEPAQGGKKSVITWFKIVKDDIKAHISGGNIRQVHKSRSFEIDASESYDPNSPFDSVRFKWTCSFLHSKDMVPGFCDNESTVISNLPVLNVRQNVLEPNRVYIFTVKVESVEEDQSEQSIQVQVVSENTELVKIECVQNCLGNKVITTSPMALKAISPNKNDSMNYVWTFSHNNDAPDSTNAEIGYYSDGDNFVTKPGMLLPAQSYQISVKVENQNNAMKQMGMAVMNLLTYPALTVGFCIIFPSQGYALITTFQIKCFRFVADYSPVTYEIFQYRLPKEEPIMISFGVSGEFNNITLAAGLPENDYSTALRVYASDSKGNFGFYEQDITVFPVAVYTNLNDELAIVRTLTFGTASTIVTNLANQEVQSVIQTILSASCSVYTLSQELRHTIGLRKAGSAIQDTILQDQIHTIVQLKDIMVEYLSHCELRSPIIAKYCSSTLTSILECDYNGILTNSPNVPYANRKAVTVLDNIVEMLHKITQQSQDTTVIRTDVLDIGTTILTSVSLLLKEPKGHGVQILLSRKLNNSQGKHLGENLIVLELAQQEIQLARQTEAVMNSMNDYASLFARYMAPHEDDYLTNPTEDICISIQKTNRGIKTATLPAYIDVNVSIISNDSNAVYDLQVITMKNNPYWWEKSAEHMNFPLIKVDVFNTIKESRSRIARVGASMKHEDRKSLSPVIYGADLKFLSPQESSLGNHSIIQGSVALKPTWNYTDSDITIHKLEFRTGGKTILVFDDQGDNVLLRVVVKENAPPDLNDFWESKVIPKFEETNLTERQKRSIFLDSENTTAEHVFYHVGILPHQATIRSLLHNIDPPVPDSFLYKETPPKPNKLKANNRITYSFKAYNAQCLRWNSLNRSWTNHCKVIESDLTETTISCHCDGLSTIGASFRAADVVKSSPLGLSQLIKFIDNSLIFWFVIYITVCFLGLFAWGGMRDRRDKKHDKLIVLDDNKAEDTYNYIILVETGGNLDPSSSARVAVILEGSEGNSSVHVLHSLKMRVMLRGARDYFLLRTPRSLGDVFGLHLWHNHKGQRPIWYIEKIIVHDVQTNHVSVFIFETWLTPLDKDGRMGLSCYRMLNNEILSLKMRLKNAIADIMNAGYHSWLGMCSRHLPRNNTRRRRVILAFVHTCILMASVTAFYPLPTYNISTEKLDTTEEFTFEWEEVIVGILAATMGFSVNCMFFGIAKNVAPAQSYTTDYSSRHVEELVIPIPAKPNIIGTSIPSDKKISIGKEIKLNSLYKPGEKQVIGKRTVPLRLPQAHNQPTVYDEAISRMGPIQAFQRIRFAYLFSHTFLYPLWILLGVVLLMALYFVLFYATFYAWAIGLRYLFATGIGLLFSFSILEPSKVIVFALLTMRRQKGAFVIDDRSRIAVYMTRNSNSTQLQNNRTAAIYKPPIV